MGVILKVDGAWSWPMNSVKKFLWININNKFDSSTYTTLKIYCLKFIVKITYITCNKKYNYFNSFEQKILSISREILRKYESIITSTLHYLRKQILVFSWERFSKLIPEHGNGVICCINYFIYCLLHKIT